MRLTRVYEMLPFFKALLNNNGMDTDTFNVVIGQLDPNLLKGQGLIYSANTLNLKNSGASYYTHFEGNILLKITKKEYCEECYNFIDMLENKQGCCKSVISGCSRKYRVDRLYTSQFDTTFENNEYIFLNAKISGRIAEIKE